MAYTALYRKWRPTTFDDIKGQDAIVTTLRNQINANRIGHAYLFCGTRGTGKTSAAKVFAKAVNCENPQNGNPCGECDSCRAIAAGNSMNVIEMDAASNNGVDDVREIKDNVAYSPTNAKYKVYIIDEVHMMSGAAFNALLKTLEEPPSYVIFILATTEPHKLPITILSRCQRYDFKRISAPVIVDRLREVISQEGIDAEEKAIEYIARSAEGGMRDALSLLDQCSAFFLGKEITYERALEVLGAVDTSVFSEFLRDIVAGSVVDAFHLIDRILINGRDLSQFVLDFTWHLRNVLLIKSTKDASEVVDVTRENMELLKQESQAISEDSIMRYIRIFSELANELKYATQKRVLTEIAVIKICKPEMEKTPDSLAERIRLIEEKLETGNFVSGEEHGGKDTTDKEQTVVEKETQKREIAEAEKLPKATQEDLRKIAAGWNTIIRALPDMYTSYLRTAQPSVRPSDGKLMIQVSNKTVETLCDNEEFKKSLKTAFSNSIGKEVDYDISVVADNKENGVYYPPLNMFGMEVIVDDNDFKE